MTSQRLHAAALSLLLLACGGADSGAPCRECPPLEGSWMLALAEPAVPTDCPALGVEPPPALLSVARRGSQLTGSLGALELRGTAYEGGRFSLSGNSADADSADAIALQGHFTATADGGSAQLAGTLSGDHTRSGPTGPRRCAVTRSFTATRP
jgi:hypothetical protein